MFLSGYKLMWMMVMFDLPVVAEDDRKAATGFRNFLLDEGFSMNQYSVYFRLVSGKEVLEREERSIRLALPPHGKVDIINITDRQYESIISFWNHETMPPKQSPDQLFLL